MTARIVGAAYPVLLLVAVVLLVALLLREGRRTRRAAAVAAERGARPASPVHPYAALLDEVALLRAAVEYACCPGWWEPGHLYRHHPDCMKESDHA
ncbi:hypothetical protein [Streptomyces sp. NPDC093109]|uniref:hypothetical protein n=1 Tax=Streptomyces sp. NPDC093109 TaxID=3154977 RepID=UPI00344EDEE7